MITTTSQGKTITAELGYDNEYNNCEAVRIYIDGEESDFCPVKTTDSEIENLDGFYGLFDALYIDGETESTDYNTVVMFILKQLHNEIITAIAEQKGA